MVTQFPCTVARYVSCVGYDRSSILSSVGCRRAGSGSRAGDTLATSWRARPFRDRTTGRYSLLEARPRLPTTE